MYKMGGVLTGHYGTRAIYRIHRKSIWRRWCVPDRECCRRSPHLQEGTILYCFRGPSTYTQRHKWWPFCCVPSGASVSCLFVGRLAIQGSLESGASRCFCSCHLRNSRTNL